MSKTEVSAGFAKFAAKTTTDAYEDARKGERMVRGIPYPVGTQGVAIVDRIICDENKPDDQGLKFPRVRIELKVESPETYRGKKVAGPGLMQTIKDGRDPSKWSAKDAWSATLGLFESMGCPTEITTNYGDFQEILDWFDDEPRRVVFTIVDGSYTNAKGKKVEQKRIEVISYDPANPFSGNDQSSAESTGPEDDGKGEYVIYRGTKHRITEKFEDRYDLVSLANGRVRTGIPKDDCESA